MYMAPDPSSNFLKDLVICIFPLTFDLEHYSLSPHAIHKWKWKKCTSLKFYKNNNDISSGLFFLVFERIHIV